MKTSLFISTVLVLLLLACSSDKTKIELFSPEAFAYQLEEGWELNATVRVKGFQQNEVNNQLQASLSYNIDLITPADTVKNVDNGSLEETNEEEFLELMVDSQIQLDTAFIEGNYELIFYVEDNFSKSRDTASVKFKLTSD